MGIESGASQFRRMGVIRVDTDPRKLLILLAVCEKNIVRYFLLAFSMIPIIGGLSNVLLHVTYIILILSCINKKYIRFQGKETLVLLFVILSIVMTCIIYPENMEYIFDENQFWETIFPCLRYYIVGLAFLADEETLDMVGKASCWGILIETLFVFAYMMPQGLLGSDDMSRSYQLLPNVLFAINYAFNKKQLKTIVVSVIGVLYLLSMGSRGPIVIALVFLLVSFINHSSSKKWIRISALAVLITMILAFLNTKMYSGFLIALNNIFAKLGLSTRIISFASSNTMFSYYSGRDDIYRVALEKIHEQPIVGYGLFGEWKWFGWNAHNLYLELMIDFGIPIAVLILLFIIVTLFRASFHNPNVYSIELILLFSCFVFVKSVFGGTFFDKWLFFILGFCIEEIKRMKMGCYAKSVGNAYSEGLG